MTDTAVSHKKIALVTGGNAGIGYETCKGLLKAGFHVVLCARSNDKANAAIANLLENEEEVPEGSTAEPLVLDLASLKSTRDAANTFLATQRPLDVCVLNAGIMALPWKKTDEDGFEQQWEVNALGHFLFCRVLLPAILKADAARIVHVSSGAHRLHPDPIDYDQLTMEHASDKDFDQWKAYGRSKLANILFSNALATRLESTGVTSNCVHPGSVKTALWANIGRNNDSGISVQEGALTPFFWPRPNKSKVRRVDIIFNASQSRPYTPRKRPRG
jgi:NAD(P)-dependent dehydrogenase (short-subunit alcohol dehydrogenase family)